MNLATLFLIFIDFSIVFGDVFLTGFGEVVGIMGIGFHMHTLGKVAATDPSHIEFRRFTLLKEMQKRRDELERSLDSTSIRDFSMTPKPPNGKMNWHPM